MGYVGEETIDCKSFGWVVQWNNLCITRLVYYEIYAQISISMVVTWSPWIAFLHIGRNLHCQKASWWSFNESWIRGRLWEAIRRWKSWATEKAWRSSGLVTICRVSSLRVVIQCFTKCLSWILIDSWLTSKSWTHIFNCIGYAQMGTVYIQPREVKFQFRGQLWVGWQLKTTMFYTNCN